MSKRGSATQNTGLGVKGQQEEIHLERLIWVTFCKFLHQSLAILGAKIIRYVL